MSLPTKVLARDSLAKEFSHGLTLAPSRYPFGNRALSGSHGDSNAFFLNYGWNNLVSRSRSRQIEWKGFPRKSVVNKLLTSYAESLDFQRLKKAHRCGSPVPASILLRKLVGMEEYPPVAACSAILAHISQSPPGAYLAAELILEIGYLFQDNRVDPRKKSNAPLIAMKPNTLTCTIALAGYLLSGTTRKAEQLLDMMPRIGVKTDSTLLIIMAHIYGRNGRREDLKKLKRHIDEAHNLTDAQFRQYYNCLLSCHLKFGALDSASQMVLEMLKKAKEARNSLAAATLIFEAVEDRNVPPSRQVSDATEPDNLEKDRTNPSHFISLKNS
ncbi:hypothetical protein Ancab_022284 [Ancistrocladus abbreviatus]